MARRGTGGARPPRQRARSRQRGRLVGTVVRPKKTKRQRRAFQPYRAPTRPPSGSFDPALDAAERAAQRGFGDLRQDAERAGSRSFSDYFDPDIGAIPGVRRQLAEGEQDYQRSLAGLVRQYSRLGTSQGESARASGMVTALGQAGRKRAANQAIDRQPLDIGIGRLRGEAGRRIKDLSLDYQRGGEDRSTELGRAGRELREFGLDTSTQRFFQSKQSGADLPTRPANERTRHGLTFRVGGRGKPLAQRRYTLPSGRQLSRKGFVNLVRQRRKKGARPVWYG